MNGNRWVLWCGYCVVALFLLATWAIFASDDFERALNPIMLLQGGGFLAWFITIICGIVLVLALNRKNYAVCRTVGIVSIAISGLIVTNLLYISAVAQRLPAFRSINPESLRFVFLAGAVYWLPPATIGIVAINCSRRHRWKYPLGFCQRCGYDLTANTSRICPECGTDMLA
jgi:hypothetical protein